MTAHGSNWNWRFAALLVLLVAGLAALIGTSSAGAEPPSPEPGTVADVSSRPCALDRDDKYEKVFYEGEGWAPPTYERYPGNCQRLRFSYGPIVIKPGQNDVLVGPVTIEKPNRDGFITRFKPNLVNERGEVPPVEQVHLHHGTWLSVPDYGSGPFFAAGEEKTIAPFPKGYGLPIKASDQWLLLYMVHSAVSKPMTTFITYDIDFVPKANGEKLGIKPAIPVWLDVRPSGYPVFNVQRGFGEKGTCTWPKQECAKFDPYGKVIEGQGKPGNGIGKDFKLPKKGESFGSVDKFTGGTLIGIGGHLHPGGLQNEIDLMRPGGEDVKVVKKYKVRSKKRTKKGKRKYVWKKKTVTQHVDTTRIYTGRAHYWGRDAAKTEGAGPPTSWDFSMEVQGFPRWAVHLNPGDVLRSNARYDTTIQASYENMGIAVALMAPDTPDGKPTAPGVDPFQAPRDNSADCKSGGATKGYLCTQGLLTHGHYKENGNYGGASGDWNAAKGPKTSEIGIANFLYTPGDLSTKSTTGIPQVPLGSNLRFTNLEGSGIYHSVTTCAFPCLGQTGAAFPLADGRTNTKRDLDLDSAELGIGAPEVGAASERLDWSTPVTPDAGYKPGEIVTYYCRIHPFMRGAFEVSQ